MEEMRAKLQTAQAKKSPTAIRKGPEVNI